MKTSLLAVCLWAQSVAALSADLDMTNHQAQALNLERRANAVLDEASTRQDYLQAAGLLEQAVKLDPENLDDRETLGWVYLDRLNEPAKAYPHLKQLAEGRPNDVNARKLFGMACSQTGRPQGAVKEFRAALKLQPDDVWIRVSLARSLARSGSWNEAEAIYQAVLKNDPNNADARLGEAEIQAWRGETQRPTETLNQLAQENPTNADVYSLRGNLRQWNWDLNGAQQDYQRALEIEPNDYDARAGSAQADQMGDSSGTLKAYRFRDTTGFLRESLEADGRAHLDDRAYLLGDVAGWRFDAPGFSHLDRKDAAAGLEYHPNRWLEVAAEGTVFDYANTNTRPFVGGTITSKISPRTGTDIYLTGAYNQPFVNTISTVEGSMRQHSVGLGLDTKLVGRLSLQNSAQWALLSDNNRWYEIKPDLSYRLFDKPETFIRAEYDYLNYVKTNATYWAPQHYSTLGPVFDTSIPVCKDFKLVADAKAPFVFVEDRFGYQLQGGPVFTLGKHVDINGTYYYSKIPGTLGTWSGHGWLVSITARF